jgi:alkylation response protein AidB-like acyl-CoA dehydrogenase
MLLELKFAIIRAIAFKLADMRFLLKRCKTLVMKLRLRNCVTEITIFLVAIAKLYASQVAMDVSVEAVTRVW